jgi:hypothetical protein
MKKITIELSDEQHAKLKEHLATNQELNTNHETFSGFSINLKCVEFGFSWLEVTMNNTLDLGDVNWKIE